jgi:hypothetical protein
MSIMSFCVVKTTPGFKKLAALYGEDLATAITIGYSVSVKKISGDQDLYYPTKAEIKDYYRQNKTKVYNQVVKALSLNPYLSEDAILSLLSGVAARHKGAIYVIKGTHKPGSIVHQKEAEEIIYKPNLSIMEKLQEDFPNIFKVLASSSNETTRVIKITPKRTC